MGIASNNWFDRVLTLNSLHVQTLVLTHVQTPFLGTPLVPLQVRVRSQSAKALAHASDSDRHESRREAPLGSQVAAAGNHRQGDIVASTYEWTTIVFHMCVVCKLFTETCVCCVV